MKNKKITRRDFLMGAGGFTLSIPFLPSLYSKKALAEISTTMPKRFIFLFTSNGNGGFNNYYPTQSLPMTTIMPNVREYPLAQIQGPISNTFGTWFDPFRSKMLLLRGLDYLDHTGGDHYPPAVLSGYTKPFGKHITIDQLFAKKIYVTTPPHYSLQLIVRGAQDAGESVSWNEVNGVVSENFAKENPATVFNSLFSNIGSTSGTSQTLLTSRKSMIDKVAKELASLNSNGRLSILDKQRLDSHVTFIRDLEKQLQAQIQNQSSSCTKPTDPGTISHTYLRDTNNIPTLMQYQIDNLVAAVKCGVTQIITLQLTPETDTKTFAFLPNGPIGEHHNLSHNWDTTKLNIINQWYSKQVADILTKLDVVEDPNTGATYLDNSIVYFGNSMGDGGYHNSLDMPVMIAGGAAGYFRTGYYIDYRTLGKQRKFNYQGTWVDLPNDRPNIGRPYNELLITLLQAMGLSPSDYEVNGQMGFGDYTSDIINQYNTTDRRSPLPLVKK